MKIKLLSTAVGTLVGMLLISECCARADVIADLLNDADAELADAAPAAAPATGATNAPAVTSTNLPPKPHWQTSASAGLTLTRGNTKTFLGSMSVLSNGKWDKNEANLGADFTYGENQNAPGGTTVKNAEAEHAFGQYNRLFNERLFGYSRVDALHDAIAAVDYRLSLGPGGGYYFIKNKAASLRAEVGPGFIFQKLGQHIHNYATLRVADRFEYKFSDHAHLWQMAEYLPEVNYFRNYIINAEIGVESALTKKMSLRTFIQDTYHNIPAQGRIPNDAKLVAALAYKF